MSKPLDFARVEAVRKHMLVTGVQMSQLFGVTRVTYYGWVAGKAIRPANQELIRTMLRKLLTVVQLHGWPTAEALTMSRVKRFDLLLELLARQQPQEENGGE